MNKYSTQIIKKALTQYFPKVIFERQDGESVAELGGQLPPTLVDYLFELGADVLEYKHHGVTSTVIKF